MAISNDSMSNSASDTTVVAVYDNYTDAQNAMQALTSAGFSHSDIQLNPQSESGSTGSTGHTADAGTADDNGGITGFFKSLFGITDQPEYHDVYSESVRRGSYVLTLDLASEQEVDRASEILARYNAVDIDERSNHWRSQGWTNYDASAPRYSRDEIESERSSYLTSRTGTAAGLGTNNAATAGTTGEMHIPIVEEELQVGKREVSRGGIRVFKRVVERPVQESVQLREEHVHVERHAVNQPATGADIEAFKEGSFEMRETAEEAVVGKTARVVEEVVIGKDVTERTEQINDTVRRTDVDIEQIPGSSTSTTTGAVPTGKKPTQGL